MRLLLDEQTERRAVVTENVALFIPLANETDQRGEAHHGLVLVDPSRYPRGVRRTPGLMVTELEKLSPSTNSHMVESGFRRLTTTIS